MLYEFTFSDGTDMRAEIGGLMEDWTVEAIEFLDEGADTWVEIPRADPRRAQIVAHLLQPERRAYIDELYAEHVIERIDDNYYRRKGHRGCGLAIDANDEHRLRKWEVV